MIGSYSDAVQGQDQTSAIYCPKPRKARTLLIYFTFKKENDCKLFYVLLLGVWLVGFVGFLNG